MRYISLCRYYLSEVNVIKGMVKHCPCDSAVEPILYFEEANSIIVVLLTEANMLPSLRVGFDSHAAYFISNSFSEKLLGELYQGS